MRERLRASVLAVAGVASLCTACYATRPSSGGGQVKVVGPRTIDSDDIALPGPYRIELVTTGLTYPTGVAFDDAGTPHVVEAGYSYGESFTVPRLVRVEKDGTKTEIAKGDDNGPWDGIVFHDGAFFVAEGGESKGGKILRIEKDGTKKAIVEGLPSLGDHHTNGPAVGPDGMIYFGQGTASNSGIVGEDDAMFGWLARHPEFHDVPCKDVKLRGENFKSKNPLTPAPDDEVSTGAFVPFGTTTTSGQVIAGKVPCSGAVMKVAAAGGTPELVAWGFRNPFGLAFKGDKLFVTDNGYDERGSRPVFGVGDLLWEVKPGTWYGWPDFSGDEEVSLPRHRSGDGDAPLLLSEAPNKPPKPSAIFGVHSSANGIDFSRSAAFGHEGEAFVALFGDMAPSTGKVLGPVGFKVVRVDVTTGVIHDFVINKGKENGPATYLHKGGLERPVAVRFDPSGAAMYVVDFGILAMTEKGPSPQKETGVLWRVTRGPAEGGAP